MKSYQFDVARRYFGTFMLAILLWVSGCGERMPDYSGDVTVLMGVSVLSMVDDQVRSDQAVIIDDGTIVWVGPATRARYPSDATVITGNYYVMPGLAEMHAHIPPASQGPDYVHDVLKMYVMQGITTIRGMLGEASHLELREASARGEIIAPRIFTSGPSFNGNTVPDAETARNRVREQFEAGYDLLKLHPGISVEAFDAIADEANKLGIDFSGHISHDVGLERTLASGKGTIDHLDRYMEFIADVPSDRTDPSIIFFGYDLTDYVDESRITLSATKTRDAGVGVVPTNTLLENVFNPDNTIRTMGAWPGMDLLPGNVVSGWVNFINIIRNQPEYDEDRARRFLDYRLQITKALHDAGVLLLLGADAPQIFNPPGFSAHKELRLLVDAGLTPFEAIKTGTVNVGTYFNEPDRTGKIHAGYRADIIMLDVNPLEAIPFNAHIRGVMVNGRYFSNEALLEMESVIRTRVQNPDN